MSTHTILSKMHKYFKSNKTKTYSFRRSSLITLKRLIIENEVDILKALEKEIESIADDTQAYIDSFTKDFAESAKGKENAKLLVKKLTKLGFYEYVNKSDHIERLQKKAADSLHLFDKATKRVIEIDSDAIIGKGSAEFIEKLRPVLEREGFRFSEVESTETDDRRTLLTINDQRFLICTANDMKSKKAKQIATERTCGALNFLLKRNDKTKVLLHCLQSESGYQAILLTEEMWMELCKSRLLTSQQLPIAPDEVHPTLK